MLQKINTVLILILLAAVAYLLSNRNSIPSETTPVEPIVNATQDSDTLDFDHTGEIAFIHVDTLNQKYNFLIDKKKQLEQEEKSIERKLRNKMSNAQKRYEELNQAAYTMTESQMIAAQEELEKLQQDIQLYQEQLTNDLYSLESSLQNELNTRIGDYLENYNETARYDYVMGYQMGGQVLYGKEAFDITEEVIDGLNEAYSKEKDSAAK